MSLEKCTKCGGNEGTEVAKSSRGIVLENNVCLTCKESVELRFREVFEKPMRNSRVPKYRLF